MPIVNGILETALYVKDVAAAARFYNRIFNFPTLLESDRLIALDVAGRSVLLLFKEGATDAPFATPGGTIPGHGGSGPTHFAFSIGAADVEAWQAQLHTAEVEVESVVKWSSGTQSIYLRDLDDNLVELITPGFWKGF